MGINIKIKLKQFKKFSKKYKRISTTHIFKFQFKGAWPLKCNNTTLIHIFIDDFLDGVAVSIGEDIYSITENLLELGFLPDEFWLDDKDGFITVNGNAKASLYDLIKYADDFIK